MVKKILQWILLIGATVLAFFGYMKAREVQEQARQALADLRAKERQLEEERKKLKDTKTALEKTGEEADAEIFDRGN